ncbi:MAG: chloride channel protein, partial [Pseudanabaenaceae cyanobacterium]
MRAWPTAWRFTGLGWAVGALRPKRVAILEAVAIGLVAALAAVLLTDGVGRLGGWRVAIARRSLGPSWMILPAIGMVGGGLAATVLQVLAPEGVGSGIPQVKAALALAPVALNFRVAGAKFAATVLALGSGLALGR